MRLTTTEYTTLVKEDHEIVIKPNVEFDEIPAGYIVTAYALIRNTKGEIVTILKPGMTTAAVSVAPAIDYMEMSKQELRELCIQAGKTFPKKANKTTLVDLLK